VAQQSLLEVFVTDYSWYDLNKLGNDLITWEGCRYLSSCSSAKLRDLTIKKISTYHLLKVLDEDLEV
jgi:hypothetical protein